MVPTSHSNGWPIQFDGTVWRYSDSGAVVNHERACARCGLAPVVVRLHHSTPQRGLTEADVDACIAPLVQGLNAAGLQTTAACCGHGHRPGRVSLEDGRELLVLPTAQAASDLDHLWPDIHGRRRA